MVETASGRVDSNLEPIDICGGESVSPLSHHRGLGGSRTAPTVNLPAAIPNSWQTANPG